MAARRDKGFRPGPAPADPAAQRGQLLRLRTAAIRGGSRHALARRVRRTLWLFMALNLATFAALLATTLLRAANAQTEYRIELSAGGTAPLRPLPEAEARALAAARQGAAD